MVAKQDGEAEMGYVVEEQKEGLFPNNLKESDRFELSELEYDKVFSRNHIRPSRCKLMEFHTIRTGDALPQKVLPRRIPPHWQPETSRQLEEMLSANSPICQPSNSPWASDVVLVKIKVRKHDVRNRLPQTERSYKAG